MVILVNQASSQRDQKQKVLLEGILRDDKQGKNQLVDNQVEVLLLRPLQLNLSSLHGQVEMEMDCSVDLHLDLCQIHVIQNAQVDLGL